MLFMSTFFILSFEIIVDNLKKDLFSLKFNITHKTVFLQHHWKKGVPSERVGDSKLAKSILFLADDINFMLVLVNLC